MRASTTKSPSRERATRTVRSPRSSLASPRASWIPWRVTLAHVPNACTEISAGTSAARGDDPSNSKSDPSAMTRRVQSGHATGQICGTWSASLADGPERASSPARVPNPEHGIVRKRDGGLLIECEERVVHPGRAPDCGADLPPDSAVDTLVCPSSRFQGQCTGRERGDIFEVGAGTGVAGDAARFDTGDVEQQVVFLGGLRMRQSTPLGWWWLSWPRW